MSEGLAGHFALELFGGKPELWESLNPDVVQPHAMQLSENWHRIHYDHNAWFYGTSDLPKWLGYTSRFNLVSRYFSTFPHLKASMLTNTNAEAFSEFI